MYISLYTTSKNKVLLAVITDESYRCTFLTNWSMKRITDDISSCITCDYIVDHSYKNVIGHITLRTWIYEVNEAEISNWRSEYIVKQNWQWNFKKEDEIHFWDNIYTKWSKNCTFVEVHIYKVTLFNHCPRWRFKQHI